MKDASANGGPKNLNPVLQNTKDRWKQDAKRVGFKTVVSSSQGRRQSRSTLVSRPGSRVLSSGFGGFVVLGSFILGFFNSVRVSEFSVFWY